MLVGRGVRRWTALVFVHMATASSLTKQPWVNPEVASAATTKLPVFVWLMCYQSTVCHQGRCVTPASTKPRRAVNPVGVYPILLRARSRSIAAWSAAPSVSLCAGGVQQQQRVEQAAGKRASLSPQTEQ